MSNEYGRACQKTTCTSAKCKKHPSDELSLLKKHTSPRCHPHERLLAFTDFEPLRRDAHKVILWDAAAGKQLPHRFRGRNSVFSADGELLVTRDGQEHGDDGVLYVWDVALGKELCSVEQGKEAHFFSRAVFSSSGKALWVLITPNRPTGGRREDVEKLKLYPLHRSKQWGMHVGGSLTVASCDKEPRLFKSQRTDWRQPLLGGVRRGVFAISSDDRLAAFIESDWQIISVRETATGLERCRFHAQNDNIFCLTFSADNRRLASDRFDTTILVWDVTGRLNGKELRPARVSAEALEQRWAELTSENAGRAGQAIWALVAAGSPTIALLEKHLQPASTAAPQAINQWITGLDANDFVVRQQARQKLMALEEGAGPNLRHALEKNPRLEKRRTLKQLLEALEPSLLRHGDKLRSLRAIEVLEHIGTPDAIRLLKTLSEGAPGVRQTQEAKASVVRLFRRVVEKP